MKQNDNSFAALTVANIWKPRPCARFRCVHECRL